MKIAYMVDVPLDNDLLTFPKIEKVFPILNPSPNHTDFSIATIQLHLFDTESGFVKAGYHQEENTLIILGKKEMITDEILYDILFEMGGMYRNNKTTGAQNERP